MVQEARLTGGSAMKGADLDLEELVKQYVYQWGNERMFPTMDVCETALRTLYRLGK